MHFSSLKTQVGLGSLGIVSELTLQCVPQHQLLEKTYVVTDLNQACRLMCMQACMHAHVFEILFPHPQNSSSGTTTGCCTPTATSATCGCPTPTPSWLSSRTLSRKACRRCHRAFPSRRGLVHSKHTYVHPHRTYLVLFSLAHTCDSLDRIRDFDKPPVPEQQKLAHVRKLLMAHPLNKVSHV